MLISWLGLFFKTSLQADVSDDAVVAYQHSVRDHRCCYVVG
jgi:hypothetical protein